MGLVDLLGRYKLGQVVQTPFTATDSLQKLWLDDLKQSGTAVQSVRRGDLIGFQDEPDVTLRVLNPGDGDILKGDQNTLENEHSIVLQSGIWSDEHPARRRYRERGRDQYALAGKRPAGQPGAEGG